MITLTFTDVFVVFVFTGVWVGSSVALTLGLSRVLGRLPPYPGSSISFFFFCGTLTSAMSCIGLILAILITMALEKLMT